MKNISLDEGLNVNLEETAAEGNQNQIAVPGNQSVRPIYEEQLAADGHRRTFSLPGESSCSKWVNQNASREDINAESGEGRSKRSRNLTPKGLAYKCNILRKEETESMEDQLGNMLPLKTYSFQQELYQQCKRRWVNSMTYSKCF